MTSRFAKPFVLRAAWVGAALLSVAFTERTTGFASGLSDALGADEAPDRALVSGAVRCDTVGDFVGGHDTRRAAWIVGPGASIGWTMKVEPGKPITLEFEEMYGRDANVRGYGVFVDGQRVHFRSFRGCGAGPVHYFVQLPALKSDRIDVKLVNAHDSAFAISRVWAFSDFAGYFKNANMAVPYRLAPTIGISGEMDVDLPKLMAVKSAMSGTANVLPAWTSWMPYANLSEFETRRRIDHVLALADAAQMPVQISFDTWWGNTPSGADGRGGFWNDVQYQQVVYNDTRKEIGLSIPNRWSNTPWPTMNSAVLNGYKAARLTRATAYLRERVDAMQASGKPNPILSINLDNEPVYWASGNAGLGNDLLWADFNPAAVADAARDGVTLDPTDGLSREERIWLHRNILHYNKIVADAAVAGLAGDATRVDATGATPDADPLANNVYTQGFVADPTMQFPLVDPTQGLWETAAPEGVRVGGEFNGNSQVELEAIVHQIALGRGAAVNAETGNRAEEVDAVLPAYALGLRYWTPYNYPIAEMKIAADEVADLSRSMPPRVYQPRLLEDEFGGDAWKLHVYEYGGVATSLLGNTAAMTLAPTSVDTPGFLTYKLDAQGGGTFEGLSLEFSGRAFVSKAKDERVQIRVLAGTSSEVASLGEVSHVSNSGDVNEVRRVDLSAVARGQKTVFVRIELHAPGRDPTTLSWCSLRRVAFTVPWPSEATENLPPQDTSIATLRSQNLLVSWRRDAELALDALAKQVEQRPEYASLWKGNAASPPARLAEARAAYQVGQYARAYHAACIGAAAQLPARYEVRQSGPLDPYPLRVEATSGPLRCEIAEWSEQRVLLKLRASGDTTAKLTLSVSGLRSNAHYAVDAASTGEFTIHLDERGAFAVDASGTLKFEADAPPAPADIAPATASGSLRISDKASVQIFQDSGDGMRTIAIGPDTTIELTEFGDSRLPPQRVAARMLARGDQLAVTIGVDGVAAKISAERRTLTGVVRSVRQLSTTTMPAIALEVDGGVEHIIDFAALMHNGGSTTPVRAIPLREIPLEPGDVVRVRMNPVNGRVMELWKQE